MRRSTVIAFAAIVVCAVPEFAAAERQPAKAEGVALKGGGNHSGRRVRLGGVTIGGSYMRGNPWWGPWGYGPYGPWANPWAWGIYDPFWYSPWVHPGVYSSWMRRDQMGEVKLDTPAKSAAVYIDGAFAGTVQDLKSIWLDPGIYNISVKSFEDQGGVFEKKVYVLSGKTLRMRPELARAAKEQMQ